DYQGREVTRYSLLWPFVTTERKNVPADSLTPLMIAARAGRLESVRALLEEGANPNAETILGYTHRTALFFAADAGHADVVQALVGADAARDGWAAEAALRAAVEHGHADVARVLVAARVGLGAGPGALVEAARGGQVEVVRALLAASVAGSGSALLAAAQSGTVDTVAALLAAGTSPDASGIPVGWTPLGLAARRGDAEIVAALLDAGAIVDARSPAGGDATPLLLATRPGHLTVVRLLLARHADPRAKDRDGYTAAAIAANAGEAEIVVLLAGVGAAPGEIHAFPLVEAVEHADAAGVR